MTNLLCPEHVPDRAPGFSRSLLCYTLDQKRQHTEIDMGSDPLFSFLRYLPYLRLEKSLQALFG